MPLPPIPNADLDAILAATAPLWEEMRLQRLFLTGGTGFFGCWLVESFLHINAALKLDAHLTVLTRSPEAFLHKLPHLRHNPALALLEGDVRTFPFPPGCWPYVIHAATEASARLNEEEPETMRSTIVGGFNRVLAFALSADTRKMLFTSSGAVYNRQPATLSHIPEEYPTSDMWRDPPNAYAQGKIVAEGQCKSVSPWLEIKIARCFAFLGPHLPLDAHFAAGNFLRDALAGQPIAIASDGSSIRSYLYAADLAVWLWTILFRAPPLRAYNVGSEDAVSIRGLAETIAENVSPGLSVQCAPRGPAGTPVHRYVPSTARARSELNLRQTVPLAEAIRRTAAWHRLK